MVVEPFSSVGTSEVFADGLNTFQSAAQTTGLMKLL